MQYQKNLNDGKNKSRYLYHLAFNCREEEKEELQLFGRYRLNFAVYNGLPNSTNGDPIFHAIVISS